MELEGYALLRHRRKPDVSTGASSCKTRHSAASVGTTEVIVLGCSCVPGAPIRLNLSLNLNQDRAKRRNTIDGSMEHGAWRMEHGAGTRAAQVAPAAHATRWQDAKVERCNFIRVQRASKGPRPMMYAKRHSWWSAHRSRNASDGIAETVRGFAALVKPASS